LPVDNSLQTFSEKYPPEAVPNFGFWNGLNSPCSFQRLWTKRRYQRLPGPLLAVIFDLYRHVTGLPAVPKVKLDHVFFPFGEKRLAKLIGAVVSPGV
jgi:hypothetical protein